MVQIEKNQAEMSNEVDAEQRREGVIVVGTGPMSSIQHQFHQSLCKTTQWVTAKVSSYSMNWSPLYPHHTQTTNEKVREADRSTNFIFIFIFWKKNLIEWSNLAEEEWAFEWVNVLFFFSSKILNFEFQIYRWKKSMMEELYFLVKEQDSNIDRWRSL